MRCYRRVVRVIVGLGALTATLGGAGVQAQTVAREAAPSGRGELRALAPGLLKESEREAAKSPESELKMEALFDIAQGYNSLGLFDDAKRSALGITYLPNRSGLVSTSAILQARAGDIEGATQSYRLMVDMRAAASPADRKLRDGGGLADVLAAIARAQIAAHDREGAMQTAGRADDDNARRTVYSDMADEQARLGDLAGARRTAHAVRDDAWTASVLGRIARRQAEAGNASGAKATVRSMGDATYRVYILDDIARAQLRAGTLAAAGAARETMSVVREALADIHDAQTKDEQTGDVVAALAKIALVQARGRDSAGAAATFAEALAYVKAIDATYWRFQALLTIGTAQGQTGDLDGARQSFTAAKPLIETFPRDARWMAQEALIKAQARAGDSAGALRTVAESGSEMTQAQMLRFLMTAQAEVGDLDEAQTTFDQARHMGNRLPDDDTKFEIQIGLVGETAKSGAAAAARLALKDALETNRRLKPGAKHVGHVDMVVEALCDIMIAELKANDMHAAKTTFDEVVAMARDAEAASTRSAELAIIAAAVVREGAGPL